MPWNRRERRISRSHRCPNGNRYIRRILNQCALASTRVKGSIFQLLYRRLVPRLGHKQAIGAVAHRLCGLIWMVLHRGVRYQEMGSIINLKARQQRTQKMIGELRSLGYRVEPTTTPA